MFNSILNRSERQRIRNAHPISHRNGRQSKPWSLGKCFHMGISTNSYEASFDSIKNRCNPKDIDQIQQIIYRHCQDESFEERILIGNITKTETNLQGESKVIREQNKFLIVEGSRYEDKCKCFGFTDKYQIIIQNSKSS